LRYRGWQSCFIFGGLGFESRPGSLFVILLSSHRHMLGQFHEISHDCVAHIFSFVYI
jgi:hypothetical protein